MNKKNLGLYFIIILLFIFVIEGYRECRSNQELSLNRAFSQGLVIECGEGYKPLRLEIKYAFLISGQKFYGNSSTDYISGGCESLRNKYYPVVYSNKTFSSHILINDSDFEEINISKVEVEKAMNQKQ